MDLIFSLLSWSLSFYKIAQHTPLMGSYHGIQRLDTAAANGTCQNQRRVQKGTGRKGDVANKAWLSQVRNNKKSYAEGPEGRFYTLFL